MIISIVRVDDIYLLGLVYNGNRCRDWSMTVAVQRSSDPGGDDEAGEGLRPRKGENLRGAKQYLSVLIHKITHIYELRSSCSCDIFCRYSIDIYHVIIHIIIYIYNSIHFICLRMYLDDRSGWPSVELKRRWHGGRPLGRSGRSNQGW